MTIRINVVTKAQFRKRINPGRQCLHNLNLTPLLTLTPGVRVKLELCKHCAAQFAFENSYNGVELSAAGNRALFSQFLSERINTRTDQYGGSLQNRSRLIIDIITEIR
jgi:hypothetical protein